MTPLTVSADRATMAAGDIGPVLASLPLSLVGGQPGPGHLIAVDGAPGWPDRAADALLQSARGLMIVQPTPVAPQDVPEASFVPVVVDYRYASNPAMGHGAQAFTGWPASALVEVAAVVHQPRELAGVLLDQLATLRRLGLPVSRLDRLDWDPAGYYLAGTSAAGVPVLLSSHVTTGSAPALRVRGLRSDLVVELDLPDPGTARPAQLVRTTSAGATTSPTLWESSHRASWRRLHAAARDLRMTNDLVELRADLSTAVEVLPTPD